MTERAAAAEAAAVAAIHQTPQRGVLVVTGGGAGLFDALLTVPGASATVLEALVPYAERSLHEFLGAPPRQACSAETARALAMRAFNRALELGGDFGFAVTASLATTRPKRGAHRAHLAFQDAYATRTWTLELAKGERSRAGEESLVRAAGLRALAFALAAGEAPDLPQIHAAGSDDLADLMLGKREHVGPVPVDAVLPGAFNPLHDGHRAMRADAARRLGCTVAFELSIANVDKPLLDYLELNRRLAQFAASEVVVTSKPTFVAKARALGGVVFVVGIDTLARIAEARYYGGAADRDAAIEEMRTLGCKFLVYGRLDANGFKTLDDLTLPAALRDLCIGVAETEFRRDISSTALRRAQRQPSRSSRRLG